MYRLGSLIPVFITQDVYLPIENIPDLLVPTRQQTTVVRSVPNPGCQYLSWKQISPPNRATNALSWVVDPNLGMEVIQFLTCQLNFKIEYTIYNPTNISEGRLAFVLPVSSTEAYEAPDVKGERIYMPVPGSGKTYTGSFTVPGQYGLFIIASPNNQLQVTLEITGVNPCAHLYREGRFCTKEGNFAYENVYDPQGIKLIRTVSSDLENYKNEVVKRFRTNPYSPCFPPVANVAELKGSAGISIQMGFDNWVDFNDPNNYIKLFLSRNGYTNPRVVSVTNNSSNYVAYNAGDNLSQFLLKCGETYKANFQLSGKSITWKEYDNKPTNGDFMIGGPTFFNFDSDFTFILYDVNAKSPAKYLNTKDEIIIKLNTVENHFPDKTDDYLSVDYKSGDFSFMVPGKSGSTIPYAIRINNFEYVFELDFAGNYIVRGFWDLNITLTLSIGL